MSLKPSTTKSTDKPKKKLSNNDLISKLESDLSVAKAEGNAQASLSISKLIKYLKSSK